MCLYDKDVLMLKATSRACVGCIAECCSILRVNQRKRIEQQRLQQQQQNKSSKSSKATAATTTTTTAAASASQSSSSSSSAATAAAIAVSTRRKSSTVRNDEMSKRSADYEAQLVDAMVENDQTDGTNATDECGDTLVASGDELTDRSSSDDDEAHTGAAKKSKTAKKKKTKKKDEQQQLAEYLELFETNKSQILQILPSLKIGMDLSKVSIWCI